MARIFILDSDPAGLACHEPGNPEAGDLRNWMFKEWTAGAIIVIPAIVDYEVRRSLILAEAWDGVAASTPSTTTWPVTPARWSSTSAMQWATTSALSSSAPRP